MKLLLVRIPNDVNMRMKGNRTLRVVIVEESWVVKQYNRDLSNE